MTTLTPKYGWQMPDPGGSPNTWGTTLNGTTVAIEQKVFDVDQARIAGESQIGFVNMYAGATPPTGWMFCNGAALSRTTYLALFNVIGTAFGAGDGSTTFNLPNLNGRAPVGPGADDFGATFTMGV